MTDAPDAARFRRVLVAFDTTAQGRALLELAADLAEALGTPLSGLFIEDEALISYAASPLAYEVTLGSASLRELSSDRMRAHYRSQARLARRLLDALHARRRIECSFLSGKGRLEAALAGAAERSDLLLLSPRVGPAFDRRRYVASRERLTQGMLALFEPSPRHSGDAGAVQVVAAAGAPLDATLSVAGRLAARRRAPLGLAVLGEADPAAVEADARKLLGEAVPLQAAFAGPPEKVLAELRNRNPRLIVVGPRVEEAVREDLARLGRPLLQLCE
jgi:nucleotide-binding universal stress UspA family protein